MNANTAGTFRFAASAVRCVASRTMDQRLALAASLRAVSPAAQPRQITICRFSLASSSWSAACCRSHWSLG
jgi:hypothetical protein